jgi:hypothetical protein
MSGGRRVRCLKRIVCLVKCCREKRFSGSWRMVAQCPRRAGVGDSGSARAGRSPDLCRRWLPRPVAAAAARGIQLTYLDPARYRTKHIPGVVAGLAAEFGRFYLLPEGGRTSRWLAARGWRVSCPAPPDRVMFVGGETWSTLSAPY